jgi:competence protein ComEC
MGYRNRYGHPHPQVVAQFRSRGVGILRSDTGGLIKFTFGEAGVVASEYRPSSRRYWNADSLHD